MAYFCSFGLDFKLLLENRTISKMGLEFRHFECHSEHCVMTFAIQKLVTKQSRFQMFGTPMFIVFKMDI